MSFHTIQVIGVRARIPAIVLAEGAHGLLFLLLDAGWRIVYWGKWNDLWCARHWLDLFLHQNVHSIHVRLGSNRTQHLLEAHVAFFMFCRGCAASQLWDGSPRGSETGGAILFTLLQGYKSERAGRNFLIFLLGSLAYIVKSILNVTIHFFWAVLRGAGAVSNGFCLVE